ncbi:hypothetical protein DVR12_20850 [Chitinophaga silvatica]|uniref:Uncharacterized protein n=2 Tax=Chitinophaga silvatica TaxID=2282649 RepID=A0A3E1Y6I8_9BACT|nr:hypothetical protein DVR12_20850 [Chitinophaga silvatica]
MRGITFLVYFLILFSKGDQNTTGRTFGGNDNYSQIPFIAANTPAVIEETTEDAQIRDVSEDLEADFMVSDNVEDEDPTSCFSLKYKLLANRQNLITNLVHLNYQHRYFKSPPTFSGQIFYKYLLQGALRI